MAPVLADDDIVETPEQGARNAREPLLVIEPLRRFLRSAGLEATEALSAHPIGDGHSNVTFLLSTGVVLRRPPRGPLPPSAHDVLREARVLRALAQTPVPVPRVLAVCDDPSVIGAPFYIMQRVDGTVITDRLPAALDTPAQRERIAQELIDALVTIHAADWSALGLGAIGRPEGYLQRQLRRFEGLWQHNRTRQLPEVEIVGRWLAEHLPQSPAPAIVHGDYRLGNTIFDASAPARLLAVLDWEMATIGDPLADVGYLVAQWVQAGDEPSRFRLSPVTALAGFPTRTELVELYERRSGRTVAHLDWYAALALWKAVVFMEGNYRRAISGATDDPYLRAFGEGVVELARRALKVTRE